MKKLIAISLAFLAGCGSSTPDSGVNGSNGTSGLKGEKGDKGDQGPPGLNGSAANRGDSGPQGATGSQGPSGPAGAPGKDASEPIVTAGARLKPEYVTYKYTASDGATLQETLPTRSWYDAGRNERCQYRQQPTGGATIQDSKPRCLPLALLGPDQPSYNPNNYVEMAPVSTVYSH